MIGVPRSEWANQAQWAVTAPLLVAGLSGVAWAPAAAVGLGVISVALYAAKLRSWRPYRLQVRLGFIAVVGLACAPGAAWLLWLPAVGTSTQVLFGYCPMARLLDLMPWNRSDTVTWSGVLAVVTRGPGDEGLLLSRSNSSGREGAACAG